MLTYVTSGFSGSYAATKRHVRVCVQVGRRQAEGGPRQETEAPDHQAPLCPMLQMHAVRHGLLDRRKDVRE